MNYMIIEKLMLALVYTTRWLRNYLQAHPITVLKNQPIRQFLMQPKRSGRMTRWAIKLGEYNVTYRPRMSIKDQSLVDFLTEIQDEERLVHGW